MYFFLSENDVFLCVRSSFEWVSLVFQNPAAVCWRVPTAGRPCRTGPSKQPGPARPGRLDRLRQGGKPSSRLHY